jgi:2-polyprenyl-6-methoxyphenol hydroxylase-like FAD-dependent oxidoreductase
MADASASPPPLLRVAIIGAGPAGLTLALALARRAARGESVRATLFERGEDHRAAATYNPDRSYT